MNRSKSLKKGKSKQQIKNKLKANIQNKSKKQVKNKSKKSNNSNAGVLTKKILRQRRPKLIKNKSKISRGVVYLSHVPHGFYEEEMRDFFSQFGDVTSVNIPRSTRTGKYRGYAFVEFLYPEVAKVVAETMDNYLMFQKILKAKYIPPEEQRPLCFHFPRVKTPLILRRQKFLRKQSHRKLNEKHVQKEAYRLKKSLNKKFAKLKKLGIDYEFQIANNESLDLERNNDLISASEGNSNDVNVINEKEENSNDINVINEEEKKKSLKLKKSKIK